MNYKFLFLALALTSFLSSCKKDLTCSCTTTYNSTGTYYSYDSYFDGWTTTYLQLMEPSGSESSSSSEEINYTGTSSTAAAGNCPAESVSTEEYDDTYPTGYYSTSGQPIISGSKGRYTVSRSCTLEKE